MDCKFFTEDYLIRRLEKCTSPNRLMGEVNAITSNIEDHVKMLWRKTIPMEDGSLNDMITTEYKGTEFTLIRDNSYKYVDYLLSFEEGSFFFECSLVGGKMAFPNSVLDWITDRLEVIRKIMPAYETIKGKMMRKHSVQKVGLNALINGLCEKHGIEAKIEAQEGTLWDPFCWGMYIADYEKSDHQVYISFKMSYFPRWKHSLSQKLDALFEFFTKKKCLSLTFNNKYGYSDICHFAPYIEDWVNEDTGEVDSEYKDANAPKGLFPYNEAICGVFEDWNITMFRPKNDIEQQVLVEISPKKSYVYGQDTVPAFYFYFDYSRYSPEDLRKVIQIIEKDLLKHVAKFDTNIQLLIDFESALAEIE